MSFDLATSKYLDVDGIRTHYLEAGEGPVLVLLHGGDFGGRAENSWGGNIDAFAQRYRVIAPDWLGFGRTDKLHDFMSVRGRMARHMGRFLQIMNVGRVHFVGNSMGAGLLIHSVLAGIPGFDARSMVLASGGGFAPFNEQRRALLEYDCTMESMVKMLKGIFSDPKWWEDEDYVRQRYEWSIEPGVWECCAAARFRAPHLPPREEFGQPDNMPYEQVTCPTFLVAGDEDQLRLPGYADELVQRIPGAELYTFEKTGHCPNIERADAFNAIVLDFLARVDGTVAAEAAATTGA